jgi:hypothetical protein
MIGGDASDGRGDGAVPLGVLGLGFLAHASSPLRRRRRRKESVGEGVDREGSGSWRQEMGEKVERREEETKQTRRAREGE